MKYGDVNQPTKFFLTRWLGREGKVGEKCVYEVNINFFVI